MHKLALKKPQPNNAISQSQVDALDEFRKSLRDSYKLNRVEGQDELLRETLHVCGRIMREYPEGCRCNYPSKKNTGLCKCCTRVFKAAEVMAALEQLSTRRFSEEAKLVTTFITTFADLLGRREGEDEPDVVASRVISSLGAVN